MPSSIRIRKDNGPVLFPWGAGVVLECGDSLGSSLPQDADWKSMSRKTKVMGHSGVMIFFDTLAVFNKIICLSDTKKTYNPGMPYTSPSI